MLLLNGNDNTNLKKGGGDNCLGIHAASTWNYHIQRSKNCNNNMKQNRELTLSFGLSFTVFADQITNLSNMS